MKPLRIQIRSYVFVLLSFLLFFNSAAAEETIPFLWEISDEDTTIHIFGTIHALKPETKWLSAELKEIVSNADGIYLETSGAERSQAVMGPLMVKYGLLPSGQTLKSKLSEDIYKKLSKEFAKMGIPELAFSRFKPWMAAITYSLLFLSENGYDPELGAEKTFMEIASDKGIFIKGLETAEIQLSTLNSLSDGKSEMDLREMFVEQESMLKMIDEMVSAWVAGDLISYEAFMFEQFGDDAEVMEKLLYARNRNWVPKIMEILELPGNYFIAVGSAHLVGKNSVIDLLEKEFE